MALEQLELAIAEDPNDIAAQFYRGITLSRLGRYSAAVSDLEAARDSGTQFPKLYFELGYAYYRRQELSKAQTTLERSVQEHPEHAASNYYLGVVYYKQQAYERALEPLATAARLDPSFAASAAYLGGDALIRLDRLKEAQSLLVEAADRHRSSSYAGAFEQLIDGIHYRRREQRPFSLEVTTAFTTDSNVGLFPDEQTAVVPEEDERDQRLEFSADARWRVLPRGPNRATLGYKFFQSVHQDLGEFDIQDHVLSVDLQHRRESVSYGFSYQFIRAYLDGDKYSTIHALIPNLTIQHGRSRASLIKFQWSDNDLDFESQIGRSGETAAIQYRHYWLGQTRRNVYVGSTAVYDDTDDPVFRYSEFGIEAGLQHSLLPNWIIRVDASYARRFYREANPDREDEHQELSLRFIRLINQQFEWELALTGINNPSDADEFDYSRYLASMLVRWRL